MLKWMGVLMWSLKYSDVNTLWKLRTDLLAAPAYSNILSALAEPAYQSNAKHRWSLILLPQTAVLPPPPFDIDANQNKQTLLPAATDCHALTFSFYEFHQA